MLSTLATSPSPSAVFTGKDLDEPKFIQEQYACDVTPKAHTALKKQFLVPCMIFFSARV
jgi:hypothetical protein